MKLNKTTCELLLSYAIYKFGKNPRKRIPNLIFSNKKSELYGHYEYYANTITIFKQPHIKHDNPVQELCDTVFHEYKHYLHRSKYIIAHKKGNVSDLENEAILFGKQESKKLLKNLK